MGNSKEQNTEAVWVKIRDFAYELVKAKIGRLTAKHKTLDAMADFERLYMNGKGRMYDGDDLIDHTLFREFVQFMGHYLPSVVEEVINEMGLPKLIKDLEDKINVSYEFSTASTSFDFNCSGGERAVAIISTKTFGEESFKEEWIVGSSPDWVNIEKTTNGLKIKTNNTDTMREGTIVLRQAGSNKTITITVKQAVCVAGTIAQACVDSNKNGKYDKAVLTLTTTQDINTPSGWTKVNARKFTKTETTNGTKNVTVSAVNSANGTKALSISVTCIGTNSGQGMTVPNITGSGDTYSINPTGGTGNYTYKWSITGCYNLNSTTAKSVTVSCKPNGVCESGTLSVVVSDGQNSVTKTFTVRKSCTDTVKPTVSVNWGDTTPEPMVGVRLAITASDNVTPTASLVYATTSSNPDVVITGGNTANPTIKVGRYGDSAIIKVRVTDGSGNFTELSKTYTTRSANTTYEFTADKSALSYACEGGTKTVNVISKKKTEGQADVNQGWEVVSKPAWVQVQKATNSFVVSVTKNE